MPFLLAFTTVANEADARRLARLAVTRKLAACVQFERIDSVYAWQGQVVEDAEWRLLFKTTPAAYPALEAALLEHHPYEEPAIYALDADKAAPAFAAWVHRSVTAAGPDRPV